MSSSPVKKRRRVDITASQKHDLCLCKEQNAKAILAYFCQKWDGTVGRSTVSDILKEQTKWFAGAKDSSAVLCAKSTKHTSMESALQIWFSDVRAHSLRVSDDIVIKKAKEFGEKLSVTDFLYSRGWFKKRHGIRLHKTHGEAGRVWAHLRSGWICPKDTVTGSDTPEHQGSRK